MATWRASHPTPPPPRCSPISFATRTAHSRYRRFGGDPLARANGINTSRTVIGMESNSTAFILPSGGPPLALPPSTAPSETAFGINDSGKILGQFTDGLTDTTHGFFLNGGVFTILNPIVIATVTHAQGMNNNGLATGFYSV